MGVGFDRELYCLDNTIQLSQHLIVPEPQHAKTSAFKKSRSLSIIANVIGMLATINLDYDPKWQTHKIKNKTIKRMLTAELHTQLFSAEPLPQLLLGIGHVAAQGALRLA